MKFGQAVRACFRNYATFSGRARRSEYWWFALFCMLVSYGVLILGALLAAAVAVLVSPAEGEGDTAAGVVFGVVALVVGLLILLLMVPSIAVSVRRLHDVGRSGWWYWLGLVPVVGGIVLIVWHCTDSGPDNRYGPSPKPQPRGGGYPPYPGHPYAGQPYAGQPGYGQAPVAPPQQYGPPPSA